MLVPLLNDKSVQQLYEYPESGVMEKDLYFFIYSKEEKGNNNLLSVILCDSKYKIKNILLDDSKGINVGDYIRAKKFTYKYEKDVEITILNYEKIAEYPLNLSENLNEYKKEGMVDCYFLYKNQTKNFVGFNEEVLEFELSDIESKIKLEDSKLYLFQRLQIINQQNVRYNNKISFISQNLGEYISNDKIKNLCINIPYCFEGKIIEINKDDKKLTIVTHNLDKVFIILELKRFHFNLEENKYIRITSVKYCSNDGNIINFVETEFTKINILNYPEKEEEEQQIFFKFNFYGDLANNLIYKLLIELNEKNLDEIKINQNLVYYMYNKRKMNLDMDYFVQNIYLFYNSEFSRKFGTFAYIGLLNEVNVDVNQIGVCAYEFIYYALEPKFLPTSIKLKDNKLFKNFQTFGNKTRKKISFINIQVQNEEDIGHGNSFLVINLCKENDIKLYGTMKLDSIEFKSYKEYNFNSTIDEFLKNIHQDFIDFFKSNKITIYNLENKYIYINPKLSKILENELQKNFKLFNIKDEKHTFDYFNSIVIWNIYNYFVKIGSNISEIESYFKMYEKIEKAKLNYVEKSMILVGIFLRLKESKISLVLPEFYFYDELPKENPYRMAYEFQFLFIDKLTEFSRLFQPLLLLDSYFMDMICYDYLNIDRKNVKNEVISSYSISMLPLAYIKNHLKKTIKKYFFIISKGVQDERIYYAAVQTDNGMITYNEKILLNETPFQKISFREKDNTRKDYAFLLNLENMHENFSHNKEGILNIKDSPTLYFNEDFKYKYIYENNSKQIGEAGALLESFICDNETLEEMKKLKYNMGVYFEVQYFVEKDFGRLIKSFLVIKKSYEKKNNANNEDLLKKGYKIINNNYNESSINNQNRISDNKIDGESKQENNEDKINEENKEKGQDHNQNQEEEKEEAILLSRYNSIIIEADTLDELFLKINDMKNKKFITPKNVIPRNDSKNYY